MKKTLSVLFFLLIIGKTTFSQGFFTYIDLSTRFFETLNEGKFADAQAFFDASAQEKVTPQTLENMWKQITAQLGAYESINGAQNKSQNDLQSVVLDCKFKRDSQPFQFIFNKENKMVGFFIVPKMNVPQYKPAAYTDTTSFKESFITIKSGEFDLPGMLTLPKKGEKFPLVIFVHGSGPSDMDETVGQNKPFKDLAAGFAGKGIASIRYVKRTMLYPQSFNDKAYTLKEEVTDDLEQVITYAQSLPEIDQSKIYIFGHSLGGMIAPKVAAKNPALKGIIIAAAPARTFNTVFTEQLEYLKSKSQDTSAASKKAFEDAIKESKQASALKPNTLKPDSLINGLPVSYLLDINSLNQVATAKKLNTRIMVIQGGNDYQSTTADYQLWNTALKNKKNVTLKLYPMLNHLFSFVNEKGTGMQYQQPGNVDEVVVNDVSDWILENKDK